MEIGAAFLLGMAVGGFCVGLGVIQASWKRK